MKKIIFADYDELTTDYRAYKAADTFKRSGYKCLIFGIRYDEESLKGWDKFDTRRVRVYKNLPLKVNMIIFWIKVFFLILVEKIDVIYSHDIFPLLPAFLASKLKNRPFIYDSHEFWHGNHHLEDRPFMKSFWTSYEKLFIKHAKSVVTVSKSIADELEDIYSLDKVHVLTNLPVKRDDRENESYDIHEILKIDKKNRIVLYQGGLLYNNGLDIVINAFTGLRDEHIVFVLIGDGDMRNELETLVEEKQLEDKVYFMGRVPQSELYRYTKSAYIGLCLIKNSGLSFYYSTPNKMFEYIQAEVPQLASNFPEMERVVKEYKLGFNIDPQDGNVIKESILKLVQDEELYKEIKVNCSKNKDRFYWENFESVLIEAVES